MKMTADVPKMFATRNDLMREVRVEMISLLNQQLADTSDLYSQVKQAHWNVKGPQFFALHGLFDRLADELLAYVDLIAERATALGGQALGTVRMSAAKSQLSECELDITDSLATVEAMADRYATLAASTRQGIENAENHGDVDSADLLTEVSRGLDKALWFLESHVQ
jgi:starvation-inducible DNA-binding protein